MPKFITIQVAYEGSERTVLLNANLIETIDATEGEPGAADWVMITMRNGRTFRPLDMTFDDAVAIFGIG